MAYQAYSTYQVGTAPAAPNPLQPANPIHEVPDSFRPDFMPLHDTTDAAQDPSMAVSWDDYAPGPGAPYDIGAYGQAEAEFGTVTRDRDKQQNTDRPVNVNPYRSHFHDEFPWPSQPDLKINQLSAPYYYDDLDEPGGFTVDRRGSVIDPSERAWGGGKGGPLEMGRNALPENNRPLDRWGAKPFDGSPGTNAERAPTDDFGDPINYVPVDVIVTVDRKMQQPYGGNLVEGLKQYPHPLYDNILAVPQAPSQFPDRAMEPADPYLPGGGQYSDRSRAVYVGPEVDVSTQAFAEPMPAGDPSYDNSWE